MTLATDRVAHFIFIFR